MTTQQYLDTLARELGFLKPDERGEVIADYTEHFASALENGESPERVISRLGSPKSVAQEYKLARRVQKAEAKPGLKSVARAVGSVALLSVYNALVIAPLYIAGVLTLVAFYAAAFSVMLAAAAGVLALILNVELLRYVQASFGFSNLAVVMMLVAAAAVGGELFIFTRVFGRWFFKGMAALARRLSGKKGESK